MKIPIAKLLICNTLSYKRSNRQSQANTLAFVLAKIPSVILLVVDRSTPHPSKFYLLQIADFIGAAGRYVAYYRFFDSPDTEKAR